LVALRNEVQNNSGENKLQEKLCEVEAKLKKWRKDLWAAGKRGEVLEKQRETKNVGMPTLI
jgi:hypothetical protein